jgi:lysophospholipase L1-like esterase
MAAPAYAGTTQHTAVRAAATGWTTTWAAAPVAAVSNAPTGYAGFTIRSVVHTSIGGNQVRIHLSNRFGTAPVLMAHVTAAVSAHAGGRADGTVDRSDGSAKPGTVRRVLFGGRGSVVIPAGADVVSDAVALAAPAGHDLLVSMWTPRPSGTVTYHLMAMQDSFYSDDKIDHAADVSAGGFPHTTQVWHYVTGVDVSGGPGTVVVLGDSTTDGIKSTWGADRRWPDYLSRRLAQQKAVPAYGIANVGISGNRLLLDSGAPDYSIYQGSGRNALARLDWDVLDRSGARTLIVLEGINDLQQEPHQTDPQQIIAGLAQIAAKAHDRKLRVIGATIMPWEGWTAYTPALEQTRQTVNKWIRSSGTFNAVADLDAATRDPADPHRLLPSYDSGDHLHPNDAGDRAMAAAVSLRTL